MTFLEGARSPGMLSVFVSKICCSDLGVGNPGKAKASDKLGGWQSVPAFLTVWVSGL